MNGYRDLSAGSQYMYNMTNGLEDDSFEGVQPRWPHLQNQQLQFHGYDQGSTGGHGQHNSHWSNTDIPPQSFPHAQHLSSSSFSSAGSSLRSSQTSGFSDLSFRDSVSSSSSWSRTSGMGRDQHVLQTEYMLSHGSSAPSPYFSSPIEETGSITSKRRPSRKPVMQEKDYFKTCVSAHKQSRTCTKSHKYFCTSCKKPFVEKADWKRHEETYQERPEMFECDLCPAIYFLEKDFTAHHGQSHRCAPCSGTTKYHKKTHVLSARKERMARTGWGCGFCCHFSSDWTERCNHLAHHMEKQGLTESDWIHSNVIHSLLQRPVVSHEWRSIIQGMQLHTVLCSWNQHSTGRVEGYPESNPVPQLQDYLEYFTPDHDPVALAHLAYRKMIRHSEAPRSRTAAPLPPLPQQQQQQVPARERRGQTLQDLTRDPDLWTQFINSVVDDDVMPQGVCPLDDFYDA
ncbi:hypothetical protein COCC4DRAFT_177794 [Bipolaris maydis ATCC 48331]|uniref:C2H2-type domain-containing protein n=2 Tax=Cochliobolus heterostrophus TaxID=5016 RepID=M2USA4_COCH5|nr:uncharacterized protein COCC4DRAFT_177794 [Bipolaris maydis ATCC 48331]EMD96456.1 hypothetical protein COCHEDRAFT_1162130 [Bipolaris maydis C5]KAJ5031647.1 hypothetical protein J3E73DRAFT_223915 [Bipolaris maydis]ENI01018.1 hypothetical protein COCC4DRAFT_177794 [Bipolaris maydis ATCC 48331]KAJ5060303.1 hypothetical protein J3E74DRAFT_244671 [Bipolaris maydis]KAJ6211107.1 hypothetical protein PSV09DRAFT_1162130 [Bipolaris maydis]